MPYLSNTHRLRTPTPFLRSAVASEKQRAVSPISTWQFSPAINCSRPKSGRHPPIPFRTVITPLPTIAASLLAVSTVKWAGIGVLLAGGKSLGRVV